MDALFLSLVAFSPFPEAARGVPPIIALLVVNMRGGSDRQMLKKNLYINRAPKADAPQPPTPAPVLVIETWRPILGHPRIPNSGSHDVGPC